jgi:hypothetical protein
MDLLAERKDKSRLLEGLSEGYGLQAKIANAKRIM